MALGEFLYHVMLFRLPVLETTRRCFNPTNVFLINIHKVTNSTFRWEEENKGDWQRGESRLEWGKCSNMQTSLSLKASDRAPLLQADICWTVSCRRLSLIWREQRWTLPPSLTWLWKTMRRLGKISKCSPWDWARCLSATDWVMTEKPFSAPHPITVQTHPYLNRE